MIMTKANEYFELEQLRQIVEGKTPNIADVIESNYYKNLKDGNMLALAIKKDNKIVAGTILSYFNESLFIEWIFTDKDYRNKGYAEKMLNYIEDNKNIFEEYYSKKIKRIQLESLDSAKGFYEKEGFNEKKEYMIKKI